MISVDIFNRLQYICQSLRNNNHSFGGIQVIVCGDFRQLKPVPNDNYYDAGHYCFSSNAWEAIHHVVVLYQVMRQRDLQLIAAIQQLTEGESCQK